MFYTPRMHPDATHERMIDNTSFSPDTVWIKLGYKNLTGLSKDNKQELLLTSKQNQLFYVTKDAA